MIDRNKRLEKLRAKEKQRKRIHVDIDPDNYEYIPEQKQTDYYDNDVPQRVAIYVRVSTDDVRQTTSFELQKKYYEDFVVKHPHWTLVKIYADEGISGTSLNKRDAFNEMIADAKRGKIDMIITKSVSRFARNVVDFIGIVRDLAEKNPPVGVFFESEAIFSLNDDSQLGLSFQATMAEEESHTRSRSKLEQNTGRTVIVKYSTIFVFEFCAIEKDFLLGQHLVNSVNPFLWIATAPLKDEAFFSFIIEEVFYINSFDVHRFCSPIPSSISS
jgi:hypothetical protein